MLGTLQRLFIPITQQSGVHQAWNGSSGQQHSTQQPPGGPQQGQLMHLVHTQPDAATLQPLPQVSQLTDQQKQELKQAVVGSFKQDSKAASKLLAKSLSDDAKRQLLAALQAAQEPPGLSRTAMVDAPENSTPEAVAVPETESSSSPEQVPEPTFKQLLRVGVTKGLPFVAFGFFDNIIMITAGEQIDLMFGAKLGLSSMAAAGLGNTVADVVGINISHTIEQKFKGMQSMAPALTKAQLALPRTQRAKWLGCAIGMASGCLLGLTPLLFYNPTIPAGHGSSDSSSASASSSNSSSNSREGSNVSRQMAAAS